MLLGHQDLCVPLRRFLPEPVGPQDVCSIPGPLMAEQGWTWVDSAGPVISRQAGDDSLQDSPLSWGADRGADRGRGR